MLGSVPWHGQDLPYRQNCTLTTHTWKEVGGGRRPEAWRRRYPLHDPLGQANNNTGESGHSREFSRTVWDLRQPPVVGDAVIRIALVMVPPLTCPEPPECHTVG